MQRISCTQDFERYVGVRAIKATPGLHCVEFYTVLKTSKRPEEPRKEFSFMVNDKELGLLILKLIHHHQGITHGL